MRMLMRIAGIAGVENFWVGAIPARCRIASRWSGGYDGGSFLEWLQIKRQQCNQKFP